MSEEYYAQVITKEEFLKKMEELDDVLRKIIVKYTALIHLKGNEAKEKQLWIATKINELTDAIVGNHDLILQAQIESEFLVFIISEDGSILMKRVTEREHNEIYKIKRLEYAV